MFPLCGSCFGLYLYPSQCIPYLGPINGGLRPGMSIYMQGHLPHHMKRFFCNLQCGEMEGSDIALHINPRFDGWDKVVFNSFQSGTWQEEKIVHMMPFHKGKAFELIIIVNTEGYQVNINGSEFYFFYHRLPVEMVCFLNIGEEVTIQTLNIIGVSGNQDLGESAWPLQGLTGTTSCVNSQQMPCLLCVQSVPYLDFIPAGMTPKRTIIIRGMVPYGANRFTINFKVAGSDDIAFHLTPRVMEGVVMRNSYLEGYWGEEENDINFCPFQEGQYFEISIRCGNRRYKVYVNGQHLCNFRHRIHPFGKVDRLEIIGEVQLSYIHF
uniref:Galectin n=1 Tax=Paramormyrops kingsleyae TaxID=1676925 RepID=A0A3B3SQI2_9TELE